MKCSSKGCLIKKAVFATSKADNIRVCKKHSTEGMIDVVNPQCLDKACTRQPKFNTPDKTKGIFCKEHADENMIDVKNPQCLAEGCAKQPTFNAPNKTRGIYCKKHSTEGMVDVKNPRCLDEGCSKQPAFNTPDKLKGVYCKEHADEDMIDVVSLQCLDNECTTRPVFNYPDQLIGIFCKEHADKDMIDVKSTRCQEDECMTRPVFNYPDQLIGILCKEHADKDMIDVKSTRCQEDECMTRPVFNYPDQLIGIYCTSHKLKGMIDVKNPQCLDEGCDTQPVFNIPGSSKGLYCFAHKIANMIDVVNPQCVLCHMVSARPHYDNHCYGCFSFANPDDSRVRNFKTKEQAFMSEIAKVYPEIILDKIISGGCSKKRPDGLIELLTHVIIVEIDENQHKGYDITCDNRRTMELSQDLNHRPIVFIRVNPDKYIADGKTVNGAFALTKTTGKLTTKPIILKRRIRATLSAIEAHFNSIPEKLITVETLFFDEQSIDLADQLDNMTI